MRARPDKASTTPSEQRESAWWMEGCGAALAGSRHGHGHGHGHGRHRARIRSMSTRTVLDNGMNDVVG